MTELAWANGSVVKAKADRPKTARGFTPSLLVLDEGAQVTDELYLSVKPMLVLGLCDLLALSTPFGKRGWFFDLWNDPGRLAAWEHYRVTAYDCPRIDRAALEQDRADMPERWFRQEYLTEFNDAVDAVFPKDLVDAAVVDGPGPLFPLGA